MLAVSASVVGVAIAFAGVRALAALQPANVPRIADVRVDAGVLGFALLVAVGTAALLGILTSLRTSPTTLRESLGEGQRTMGGGRGERARQGLVVAQVALTMVLLVGAGLLARSFMQVLAVNPGYSTANAVVLDLMWTFARDPEVRQRRVDSERTMLTELGRLPGVERVGLISSFPLGSGSFPNGRFIEMTRPDEIASLDDFATKLRDTAKARSADAGYRVASEDYFAAMDIPLIRGRLFEVERRAQTLRTSRSSASRSRKPSGPGRTPSAASSSSATWTATSAASASSASSATCARFLRKRCPVRSSTATTSSGPRLASAWSSRPRPRPALTTAARQIVRSVDPEVPLQVRTVEDAFDRALAGRRFSLLLIGVFSACALVLATLGVYGLMAYLVSQRTREIGIRLALGAESTDVVALVVGRGVRLAVIGVAIGGVAALLLTRLLDGMLFGVTATDPIAFASVIAVTLTAVLAATWVPARRAMKVAPVVALRAD